MYMSRHGLGLSQMPHALLLQLTVCRVLLVLVLLPLFTCRSGSSGLYCCSGLASPSVFIFTLSLALSLALSFSLSLLTLSLPSLPLPLSHSR